MTKIQTKKEFEWKPYDYSLELEKKWQEDQRYFSERELLKIFPEAKPYIKRRIKNLKLETEELSEEIRNDLKKIYARKLDEFTLWFFEEVLRVFKGEKLNQTYKEIRKLKILLYPQRIRGKISTLAIENAKKYPFQNLIKNKRNFALCPFHKEKRPSFYIRKNFGHCFSCGWSGDTIKFIQETEGLSFPDAIKLLT